MSKRPMLATTLLLLGFVFVGRGQDRTDVEPAVVVSHRTKQLLLDSLAVEEPSLRSRSLAALGRIADASTADAMQSLITAKEPAVRVDALAALETVLPPDELIEVLRGACADDSDRVARYAYGALGRVAGEAAYAALVEARRDVNGQRAVFWARAVAQRPENPPGDVIEALLDDEDPRIRTAGSKLLSHHPELVAVARRVQLLSDPDVLVRAAAARSLGAVASEGSPRAALLARLSDRSPLVRRCVLEALQGAAPPLTRIAPLLEDEDSTVRRAAVDVVAAVDTDEAVALLTGRLSDAEVLVARRAGRRLAERRDDRVAAALERLLLGGHDQAAAEAARALGLMKHTASAPGLIGLVEHRAPEVRAAVYEALGRLGDRAAVPVLIARGGDEKTKQARAALNEALGRLGDRRAVAHLVIDIHYPDYPSMGIDPANFTGAAAPYPPPYPAEDTAVAAAAVLALGRIGDSKALPELLNVSKDVLRNAEFWTNFAWSLQQLGKPDEVSAALEQIGVVGAIAQNTRRYDFADSTRTAALRAIAHLELRDLAPRILNIEPRGCSTEVRKAAAEALTALTGKKHAYRRPVETAEIFFYDIGRLEDEGLLKLPICYAVDEQ